MLKFLSDYINSNKKYNRKAKKKGWRMSKSAADKHQ